MEFDITARQLIKRAFKDGETPTARAFGILMAHSSSYPQLFELVQGVFRVYLKEKFRQQSSYKEFIIRVEARAKEKKHATHQNRFILAEAKAAYRPDVLQQEGFHNPQQCSQASQEI